MNLLLVKSIYSLSNTNFVFNTVIQGNVADARIVEHYINLNISPEEGFPLWAGLKIFSTSIPAAVPQWRSLPCTGITVLEP